MPGWRASLAIVGAGVLTFGVVFALLQVARLEAAPDPVIGVATPELHGANPLIASMPGGKLAIGVPISGSELLLRDIEPGDRLDILASLPSPADGRPVTGVIVSGATVLQPATATDPLLLEVQASDAMALAHLVLAGTHLGYIVWSASGASPAQVPAVDERTARLRLGLLPAPPQELPTLAPAPLATSTAVPVVVTATAAPTQSSPTSAPARISGFLYQVQDGDTWDSVAAIFGLSASELKRWNPTLAEAVEPVPLTLVFIPR